MAASLPSRSKAEKSYGRLCTPHPAFLILVTQDQFTGLAIHHRPLAAVLVFSVEMPNLWPAVMRAAGTLAGPSIHPHGKDRTT